MKNTPNQLDESIFEDHMSVVPEITVKVLRHVDLGDRVVCAYCEVNGLPAKRLTQDIYGKPVNKVPVWNLNGRIVANWFALLVEAKYQDCTNGQSIVIYQDETSI